MPQSRDRVYIIGTKGSFVPPVPIKLPIGIEAVLEKNVNDPYYFKLTPHKKQLIKDSLSNGLIDNINNNWVLNLNVSSYKRTGARLGISPCLLAGGGGNCTFVITSLMRKLTPVEYLRLQGFPPDFKICVSRA